jgi:hypothetical protein
VYASQDPPLRGSTYSDTVSLSEIGRGDRGEIDQKLIGMGHSWASLLHKVTVTRVSGRALAP